MKILLFIIALFTINSVHAYAQEMSGDFYKIDLSPNAYKGNKIDKNMSIIDLSSHTISGDNFSVTYPYVDDYNNLPLGITLSNDILDFGTIESGEPITRSHTLTVFSPSERRYSIFLYQDTGLTAESKIQIPNTSCDSGSCTSILADTWTLPLTYGFGYTCENKDTCVSSFQDSYYRRLASASNKESPAEIITGVKNTKTNIIFKLNVAPTQNKDIYSNTIYYILTPTF